MTKNRHDLTPEHTARKQSGDFLPEVEAAYDYVDRVTHTADMYSPFGGYAWHGWALREAFLAGCSHARTTFESNVDDAKVPTDEQILEYWIEVFPEYGSTDPVAWARSVLARWGTIIGDLTFLRAKN